MTVLKRIASRLETAALTPFDKMQLAFKKSYPVVLDLAAVRVKGGMLEDARRFLIETYGLEKTGSRSELIGGFLPSMLVIHESADKQMGVMYAASSGGGIPDVKIGVQDKQAWLDLRAVLRAEGYAR